MRSSPLIMSSAETAARAQRRRHVRSPEALSPAYVRDPAQVAAGRRRVLLDLAPETIDCLLWSVRASRPGSDAPERLLVEALEKAR